MNAFTRSEALMATDQLKESGGDPSIDTPLLKACWHEQTQIRFPASAYGPAKDTFETFIDGGGI
jgi:hypothetical protein